MRQHSHIVFLIDDPINDGNDDRPPAGNSASRGDSNANQDGDDQGQGGRRDGDDDSDSQASGGAESSEDDESVAAGDDHAGSDADGQADVMLPEPISCTFLCLTRV